jgi:Flp pilus assembly protein TadG
MESYSILRKLGGWRGGSRGSVAVLAALLMPPMLGAVALATDTSMWFLEQHRIQIAADAAAYAAALQLQNTAMHSGAPSSYVTLVTNEVKAVTGNTLIGTMATPVVSVAADYSSVTVTLSSTADTFFAGVLGIGNITIRASATGGTIPTTACVVALNPTAANALQVGGSNGAGSITATNCGVFSNSTSSSAISVNSASITATSIGTAGGISLSNSGSNHLSPSPGTTYASPVADPNIGMTVPTPGACTYNGASFTSYRSTPYTFSSGTVFCGNTTIGGNGSTDQFSPGIYYVTGNITFNNANVTLGTGVTFVLTSSTSGGTSGSFSWVNNAGATLTAPTSNANGGIPGILLWQTCPNPNTSGAYANVNGVIDFNNGSPVTASGTIYAPCGSVKLENNASLTTVSGGTLNVLASTIYVTQSASLQTRSATASGGSRQVAVLQ